MFGKKQDKSEKTFKPQAINDLVSKHLREDKKANAELIPFFRAVIQKRPSGIKAFDIRIFDPEDANANKAQVKDFESLGSYPNLIIYEGWFDDESKHVELEEKKKVEWLTSFLTRDEIQKKIETLTEPGSTLSFYVNAGSASGGPLGKGAAVVELNRQVEGKKSKKYSINFADIIDNKPVLMAKAFDSDKSKDIAAWISDSHNKRLY
jgi:hypothetical protein